MKKLELIRTVKVVVFLMASMTFTTRAAVIILNTGDAWSPAIPADFNNPGHGVANTSSTLTTGGLTITLSSTGGILEHFLDTFGVGTEAGAFDGELSFGETLTFSFSQAVSLTSFQASYWDGQNHSYTIGGTTYNESGDGVKLSQTADTFTSITFNQVSGNGGFSDLTFDFTVAATPTPEPSSLVLMCIGAALLSRSRKKKSTFIIS